MTSFIKKHPQSWTLLYVFIYFPWFYWLEQRNVEFTMIYSALDFYIPFNEYFIIPYFIWFFYVPLVLFLVLFKSDKWDFYKLSATLFIGMTVCLIIYTVWPNAQPLRVSFDVDKNIFTRTVALLYKTDTSTNVLPSIHAYNSIVCHVALCKLNIIKDKKFIKSLSFVLMALICFSTVFLKQHSILDVFASIILFLIMYSIVYQGALVKANEFLKKSISNYKDSSSRSSR